MAQNNTKNFARRCPLETFGEDGKGNTTYRFDTRLLCGDFTLIKLPTVAASEEAAREVLLKELVTWDFWE